MPWGGFHYSVEFLTPTALRFAGYVGVGNEGFPGQRRESYGAYLSHDVTSGTRVALKLSEEWTSDPAHPQVTWHETWFDLSSIPINEWLRLSMWHDPASGLIHGEVRQVSDDQLVVGASFSPGHFGGASPLAHLQTGVGEFEWQYLDNVTLTPEPAPLALLALGGLLVLRRPR